MASNQMTDPARASRLWLTITVATLWVVSVGAKPMPHNLVASWKPNPRYTLLDAQRLSVHGLD